MCFSFPNVGGINVKAELKYECKRCKRTVIAVARGNFRISACLEHERG